MVMVQIFYTVFFPPFLVVSDEPNRELEVTPRDHVVPTGSLQSREEKQETVVVRPYPQVQMLTQHHTVPSGVPVTVAAPPTHLASAVPLTFPEGLIKVMKTNFIYYTEL